MNTLCEVTVVIPAYNAEKYIEKTLASVFEQTVACKVIVVDDASKDETLAIVQKYQKLYPDRVQVIHKSMNEGVSAARNDGVKTADTEYVAFLDADDWWDKDKTEIQLSLVKESKAVACYSGRELMTAEGDSTRKIISVPETVTYKELLKGNVIPCSSVLMRRDVALQYPMDHDELHEDYIMWLEMLRDEKKFVGVDKPLLKSRLGEGGKSRNKWKSAKMTYGVYRYMKISAWKAVYYFLCYICQGVKKYM